MKNIKFNLMTDENASLLDNNKNVITENPDFPVVNVLDTKPRKIARSTSESKYTAGFRITPDVGYDSFALFNTNGYVIEVSVIEELTTDLLWGPVIYDLSGITTLEQFMLGEGNSEPQKSLVEVFCLKDRLDGKMTTRFNTPTRIDVLIKAPTPVDELGDELDIPEKYMNCGILWAGVHQVYPNPKMGLSKGYVDKSVIDEFNSGSVYIRKRPGWRTFNGTLFVDSDKGRYEFDTYMADIGPLPIPWKIVDSDGHGWNVFARASATPSIAFSSYEYSDITFTLTEVL